MSTDLGEPGAGSPFPQGPIAEHAELFAHAFEHAPVIITIHHGPDHVLVYFNAAARRTTAARHAIDLPLAAIFPEDEIKTVRDRFDQAYRSGLTVQSGVYRMREVGALNPDEHYYVQTVVPRFDAQDEVVGVTSFTLQLDADRASARTN